MPFEALAEQLAREGLPVFVDRDPEAPLLPPAVFLAELIASDEPRLNKAFRALLLLRPDFAAYIDDAHAIVASYGDDVRDLFELQYEAARCLQEAYSTRLEFLIGAKEPLPAKYADRWNLPPLDEAFGLRALRALAEAEKDRFDAAYDVFNTYLDTLSYIETVWVLNGGLHS